MACRLVALAALVFHARLAGGQEQPPRYGELRADAIIGRWASAQGGVGLVVPLDVYTRLGIDGAIGTTWRNDAPHGSGRVDAIARFLLDPFREAPFGLSLGGGVSVPYVAGDTHVRPYLTAVIDVEGRMRGAVTPALEVGLGGGARIGLVLRRSSPRWR
jgi:hypothetical protein